MAHSVISRFSEILPLRVTITRIGETTPFEAELAVTSLDSSQAIYDFWTKIIALRRDHEPDKEHLVAIVLNTDLRPRAYHIVSVGSLNEAIAHPREVFRAAILAGGYAIALVHNHPSGNCTPSMADRRMTKQLVEAAAILQIPLLDHVIVGNPGNRRKPYFSFQDDGHRVGVRLIECLLPASSNLR